MLSILGSISEFETELRKERQLGKTREQRLKTGNRDWLSYKVRRNETLTPEAINALQRKLTEKLKEISLYDISRSNN